MIRTITKSPMIYGSSINGRNLISVLIMESIHFRLNIRCSNTDGVQLGQRCFIIIGIDEELDSANYIPFQISHFHLFIHIRMSNICSGLSVCDGQGIIKEVNFLQTRLTGNLIDITACGRIVNSRHPF